MAPAFSSRPLLTETLADVDAFVLKERSLLVYGCSPEDRSVYSDDWLARLVDVDVCRIEIQDATQISVAGQTGFIALRSEKQLAGLWKTGRYRLIYIDITGLSHHVWAPVLRSALSTGIQVRAVYTEPFDYRFNKAPTEGEIFDLSERIQGVAPIPGFTSLTDVAEDDVCFIPLLGF
jgi:hypothetical protein